MHRPLIFISAPYTVNPKHWTTRVLDAANIILKKGGIPFVPHLTHFWHEHSPKEWEEWIVYDSYWLEQCDAMLILGRTVASSGRDSEEAMALSMNKPIFEEDMLTNKKLFIVPTKSTENRA